MSYRRNEAKILNIMRQKVRHECLSFRARRNMYTISNLPEYIYIGNLKEIYSVAIDVSLWINLYGTSDINIYFIPPNT